MVSQNVIGGVKPTEKFYLTESLIKGGNIQPTVYLSESKKLFIIFFF